MNSKKIFQGGLILIIIVLFFPFIFGCFFAHPIADDWCYACGNRTLFTQFSNTGGRLIPYTLLSIKPIYEPHLYFLAPLLGLVVVFSSLVYFYFSILNCGTRKILLISVLTLLMFLTGMPSLNQSFYWFTGLTAYIFPAIFLTLLISFFIRKYNNNEEYNIFSYIKLTTLFILALFTHELNTVSVGLVLGCFFIFDYSKNKKIFNIYSLFIVFYLIGSFIVFQIPGNVKRSSRNSPNIDLNAIIDSSKYAISEGIIDFVNWFIISPEMLFFTIVFLLLNLAGSKLKYKFNHKTSLFIIGSLYCFIFSYYFFGFLALGSEIPKAKIRMKNTIFIISFISYIIILVTFILPLLKKVLMKLADFNQNKLSFILVFFIALSLYSNENMKNITADILSGEMKKHRKEYLERDLFLLKNENSFVRVDKWEYYPNSICSMKTDFCYTLRGAYACYRKYYNKSNIVSNKDLSKEDVIEIMNETEARRKNNLKTKTLKSINR